MANRLTRPTTILTVSADLKARATPDQRDCHPFLLGTATALLAEANREIERLERKVAELTPHECPTCENVYTTQAEADACCSVP